MIRDHRGAEGNEREIKMVHLFSNDEYLGVEKSEIHETSSFSSRPALGLLTFSILNPTIPPQSPGCENELPWV